MLKPSAPTDFALIRQAKDARSRQMAAVEPLLANISPMSEASTPTASPVGAGDTKSSKFNFEEQSQNDNTLVVVPTDEKYSLAVVAAGLSQSARPNIQSIKVWTACMAVYLAGLAVAMAFDRTIITAMSEVKVHVNRPVVAKSSLPKITLNASVPKIISNALIPTSGVVDGLPKPDSSVVVSTLSLQSVEQAFVHGASFIGATVGPVFGPVFSEEDGVDLDDGATDANIMHRFHALEKLIAGALPTTYYFV